MKTEKKIFVEPNDSDESVFDRVRNSKGNHVVVNVARSSLFGSSVEQFQTLIQEAGQAQKELTIESIDDHVLELAALAGARAINPIFMTRARAVTDIVPRPRKRNKRSSSTTVTNSLVKNKRSHSSETLVSKIKDEQYLGKRHVLPHRKRFSRKTIVILTGIIVILVGLFLIATKVLPKATITLTLIKTPVTIDQEITVESDVLTVEAEKDGSLIVPGELLITTRNIEIPLETNGFETSGGKAAGNLLVYNAYNTQPQILVATTRFESPDGKIFRLNKQTTIPGATMSGGELVPGSTRVEVTADESGESFNVRASKNWQIPGFEGTPRYGKFYAEATSPMMGGFLGSRAVPTEEDISAGEAAIEKILKDALEGELYIVTENKLKVLDGATSFYLLRKDVQARSDQNQGFGMFGEAELRHIVFDENMLQTAVIEKATKLLDPSFVVKDVSFSYGSVSADFEKGTLSFIVTGSVILQPPVAKDVIIERFAGADEALLKLRAISIEGLDHVEVNLWPFWVSHVPKDVEKIELIVE